MISENLMKIGGNVLNNALGYYRGMVNQQPFRVLEIGQRK